MPIGIFDSGVGGLTVARQIHRVLPWEDLVYLGDTARVPYGTKAPATVVRFACEDTRFLVSQRVKAVVVACNSASAWALPELERRFSPPIFGVIQPGVRAALERTRNGRIGVIGTKATIRSGAYREGIMAGRAGARVYSRACPLLVPLVEEGWTSGGVTTSILREYLLPLRKRGIDTLILGCTHYPLLKRAIRGVLGKGIELVDSAVSCSHFVSERLGELGLLRPGRERQGVIRPFVTDEAGKFSGWARRFLGVPTEEAVRVELTS